MTESRTYRGTSLEEILPRIREELGPDAVITRQREGTVGGVGGFFAKRMVEVEARPAQPEIRASVPPRAAFSAYDDTPHPAEADEESEFTRTIREQAAPFAEQLDDALGRPAVTLPPPLPFDSLEPAEELVAETPLTRERVGPDPLDPLDRELEPERLRLSLVHAGFPRAAAAALVADAQIHGRAFAPERPLRELVRESLARMIPVRHGWRGRRRTIALVGLPGSGKTLTAAKLSQAYAGTLRSVAAVSLEEPRAAMRLATLTELLDVRFDVASDAASVTLAANRLRDAAVVVADTPSFSPDDQTSVERLAALLGPLDADETHLLLPAGTGPQAAVAAAQALAGRVKVDRIVITKLDCADGAGAAIGLAIGRRVPLSYTADGPLPIGGIAPANGERLAKLVLP
jgi:flagellar biosynthesis GTPase FlhF